VEVKPVVSNVNQTEIVNVVSSVSHTSIVHSLLTFVSQTQHIILSLDDGRNLTTYRRIILEPYA
jgi:hypothetical protein